MAEKKRRRRWSGKPMRWRIQRNEGLGVTYTRVIPRYKLDEAKLPELLRRLMSRELGMDEIIDQSLDDKSPLFDVQQNRRNVGGEPTGRWGLSVGSNPWYSVTLVERQPAAAKKTKRATPPRRGVPK
jgi:hypothetical protein